MTYSNFYVPHKRVTLNTGDVMVTKQSHKDECDINRILKQFQRTGIITHVQNARPTYEDLPSDVDFQESLNTILTAEEAFSGLPSKVRAHFNNNPAELLAALNDPAQADQLRDFGILNPLPAAPPPLQPPPGDPAPK